MTHHESIQQNLLRTYYARKVSRMFFTSFCTFCERALFSSVQIWRWRVFSFFLLLMDGAGVLSFFAGRGSVSICTKLVEPGMDGALTLWEDCYIFGWSCGRKVLWIPLFLFFWNVIFSAQCNGEGGEVMDTYLVYLIFISSRWWWQWWHFYWNWLDEMGHSRMDWWTNGMSCGIYRWWMGGGGLIIYHRWHGLLEGQLKLAGIVRNRFVSVVDECKVRSIALSVSCGCRCDS